MNNVLFMSKENLEYLSSIEIGVLLTLNGMCGNQDEFCFSQQLIQYAMFNEINESRRSCEKIVNTINGLVDEGFIDIVNTYGNGNNKHYIATKRNIVVDTANEAFVKIPYSHFNKVTSTDIKVLKVFMAMVSTINNKTNAGYESVANMCAMFNININTFMNHKEIIEDKLSDVFYIRKNGSAFSNGFIKQLRNTYGYAEHKLFVDKASDEYLASVKGIEYVENEKSDLAKFKANLTDRRSVTYRYKAYMNDKNAFTNEQVETLVNECNAHNEYNRRCSELSKKKLETNRFEGEFVGKYYDMTIFGLNNESIWGTMCTM